ncbi:MAG: YdcF family protein [Acidobacteriota bacterium]
MIIAALRRFVEVVILPPAGPMWAIVLGALLLMTRWRRSGRWLVAVGFSLLFLLSTPLVESWMIRSVDRYAPLDPSPGARWPQAEAIVVLGAGVQWGSREWGFDAPSPMAVARLRYAAEVHRRTGAPVLVTGYTGDGMKNVMEQDFGIPVRWIEDQSYDTWENAQFSGRMLASAHEGGAPIRRVYLVTHFWHMPRAVIAFEASDLEPVPAPMGFIGPAPREGWVDRLRPQPSPLGVAKWVSREWIGWVYYRWRARSTAA